MFALEKVCFVQGLERTAMTTVVGSWVYVVLWVLNGCRHAVTDARGKLRATVRESVLRRFGTIMRSGYCDCYV